jgi:AcrR family transcriptional regulator
VSNRRTGRRPGDPEDTKQAILDAARRTFATNGFDRATIRAIATEAGVDPALVMHHFGNKRSLFVAAHELPVDPADVIARIAEVPMEARGEAAARFYLQLMAGPNPTPLSLMRAAASEPAAATMLREFLEDTVIPLGSSLVNQPEHGGPLRMTLIASHLVGIAVARQVIEVTPMTEADLEDLIAMVAPVIQHYVDGPTS